VRLAVEVQLPLHCLAQQLLVEAEHLLLMPVAWDSVAAFFDTCDQNEGGLLQHAFWQPISCHTSLPCTSLQLPCVHILQYGFNKLFIIFQFLILKAERLAEWSPTGSSNNTFAAVAQARSAYTEVRTCWICSRVGTSVDRACGTWAMYVHRKVVDYALERLDNFRQQLQQSWRL